LADEGSIAFMNWTVTPLLREVSGRRALKTRLSFFLASAASAAFAAAAGSIGAAAAAAAGAAGTAGGG
jgi:hypothetical protein